MPTLQETLLAPDLRPHVIADCEDLVDREVANMSGVTGTAIKLAYKTVRTFDAGREDEVAEALLAITDSRQRASSRPTIVKAYKSVRGSAVKHVKAALPALGALVQKYMR